MVVLSHEGFGESVSEALRAFTNVPRLSQNPLVRSRLVIDRIFGGAEVQDRVAKLRELILDAAQSLNQNSKDEKLFQALDTCYFHPLRSQEAATEKVDVSIATFRRHLKAGAGRITDLLWQQETGL